MNKKITLSQSDLSKYKISNTSSGTVIGELAYSAKQWAEDDLYENNIGYEPSEPYQYDYENDLLAHTKTNAQFSALVTKLCSPFLYMSFSEKETKDIQVGAYCALTHPDEWTRILKAYTELLKQDRTESISEEYNEALQEEVGDYYKQLHKEYLYGDRDQCGVIKEIAKYYTEDRDCGSYDKKSDEYTFEIPEAFMREELETYRGHDANTIDLNEYKSYLLGSIASASNARKAQDTALALKRKAERDALALYKKAQAEKADCARKEKLSALKI